MSAYNRRSGNVQNTKMQYNTNDKTASMAPKVIPGTPLQQMWTILNFHEQRLSQMTQYLQQVEAGQSNNEQQAQPTETEQMIQYNTLLQQVSELSERVAILEAKKTSDGEEVTLSIEEDFQNASLGQPEV
tara:strand:- start:138 stop:527 length:390 start_codon:yes stop_codon:yes gene_type:complete